MNAAPEHGPERAPERPPISPGLKFALEVGPLLLLVALTFKFGLLTAVVPFAAASVIATAALYALQREVNVLLVVSTIAVAGFAAAAWWWGDAELFKLKVTITSAFIGAALLVGVALGKAPLRSVLGSALQLDERGWRIFTVRFGLLFLFLAALNEVVRRSVDDEGYALAKLVLFFPLPVVFMLTQLPFLRRHAPQDRDAGE